MLIYIILIIKAFILFIQAEESHFPDDFLFGVSTSAYQIEGAWNQSGKGENIWDRITHTHPDFISDKTNADIACDSYHKLKEDINNLQWLGVNFYRFSISWTRILPTGFPNKVNTDGVRYYNQLIDGLLALNITPMVTMYHWDLPQSLQDIGGWPNIALVDHFVEYARILFTLFGDRVKLWVTINEPKHICIDGYSLSKKAPGIRSEGIADYLCIKTILLSHATVYRMYEKKFKKSQQGKVGIVIDSAWWEPGSSAFKDIRAANIGLQYYTGMWMHPIFSKHGNYPSVIRKIISQNSKTENFSKSRLPHLSADEVNLIRGSYDFLGLNYYSTFLTTMNKTNDNQTEFTIAKDLNISISFDSKCEVTDNNTRISNAVWGFRKLLNWIRNSYENPLVYVTENGCIDNGELRDSKRIKYLKNHIQALLDAITLDECNVRGYAIWSIMDNFEWEYGYKNRYGLIHIDFDSSNRTRSKKESAFYYQCVIKDKTPSCNETEYNKE